jgi:hypothetical protein
VAQGEGPEFKPQNCKKKKKRKDIHYLSTMNQNEAEPK